MKATLEQTQKAKDGLEEIREEYTDNRGHSSEARRHETAGRDLQKEDAE